MPPHLVMYMMPKTQTTVMIIPATIATAAPVKFVISFIVRPAKANNPTIISFQIRAITNPKAAAIAVDMFIFTSLNFTIFLPPHNCGVCNYYPSLRIFRYCANQLTGFSNKAETHLEIPEVDEYKYKKRIHKRSDYQRS